MATFSAIFVPDGDMTGTVANGASSGEIVIGSNKKFVLNATGDVNIAFGVSGMAAASASRFRIPSGMMAEYDMGRNADRIRIWNPGAAPITYWIQILGN